MSFVINNITVTEEEFAQSSYKDVNIEKTLARIVRDRLLAETDWWSASDLTMTAEQTAYRQALRDIPAQSGFPDTVTWPTKPEGQ